MKNKYERLTKNERKQVAIDYKSESEKNKKYYKNINNLKVIAIIGLIYGLISLPGDLFILHPQWYVYVIDAVVVIFSVYMLVQAGRIKSDVLNAYLIKREALQKAIAEEKEVKKKRTHKSKNSKAATTKTKASTKKKETTTKSASKKTATKKTTKKTTRKSTKKDK